MTIRLGTRVIIIGKHPGSGHRGRISGRMTTPVGEMWRVELDNGMNAGARDENVKVV